MAPPVSVTEPPRIEWSAGPASVGVQATPGPAAHVLALGNKALGHHLVAEVP
jgi:hypothetical protein